MKKNTKKQIANIFFVVILFLIMIYILSKSTGELNFSNIKDYFFSAKIEYLVLAFCCWILFILFEAISLDVILNKFGYKPRFVSSIAYTTADTYYSAITPSASGGQPASAFYMVRDGVSGGTAGFSLVFNLIGYTLAILIIGTIAMIFGMDTFLQLSAFLKTLIILGFVLQVLLLSFFVLCMCKHSWVKKCSYGIINFLSKIKIVRKKDKWLGKVDGVIDKYSNCYQILKSHKKILLPVVILNVSQRASQVMISCFVCKAGIDCSFWEIFILQSLVLLGYNSIPLPGGSIAYEYLYLNIFGLYFSESFIVVAVMITRIISYYLNMLISGIFTICYHLFYKKEKIIKEI